MGKPRRTGCLAPWRTASRSRATVAPCPVATLAHTTRRRRAWSRWAPWAECLPLQPQPSARMCGTLSWFPPSLTRQPCPKAIRGVEPRKVGEDEQRFNRYHDGRPLCNGSPDSLQQRPESSVASTSMVPSGRILTILHSG